VRVNPRLVHKGASIRSLDALGDKGISVRRVRHREQDTCRAKQAVFIQALAAVVEIAGEPALHTQA